MPLYQPPSPYPLPAVVAKVTSLRLFGQPSQLLPPLRSSVFHRIIFHFLFLLTFLFSAPGFFGSTSH